VGKLKNEWQKTFGSATVCENNYVRKLLEENERLLIL